MNCIDGTNQHHWLVESPEPGKKNLGAVCRRCEGQRTYPVVIEDVAERWARAADGSKPEPVLVVY